MKKKVTVTHPEKIIYPELGVTKKDLVTYYQNIAPFLLPYVKNRPMVMRRYIHGIHEESFFQKQIGSYFPEWLHHSTVPLKHGGEQELVVLDTAEDLMYLANQGVLEFHAWLSTTQALDNPDKMVFDLDPSKPNDLENLRLIARALKKELELNGYTPTLMTTGSHGYHIVVSIKPNLSFAAVHELTKQIATSIVELYPDLCTLAMSKSERQGKIFIDYLRNSYGQTSIAPYSLRANPAAGVATPIEWQELTKTDPQTYTIKNIFRRLGRKR